MQDNYKKAKNHFAQAYKCGRYRMGRLIKVLIHEYMYCCIKTGDKNIFKQLFYWLEYILDQKFTDMMGKSYSWEEYWHLIKSMDMKTAVFTNKYNKEIFM